MFFALLAGLIMPVVALAAPSSGISGLAGIVNGAANAQGATDPEVAFTGPTDSNTITNTNYVLSKNEDGPVKATSGSVALGSGVAAPYLIRA